MTVRPLARGEVEVVARHLSGGHTDKHRDRLAQQEDGRGLYLIAWLEGEPVGHVFIRVSGAADVRLRARAGACPYLQDLYVTPQRRSRGVGTQLLAAAEAHLRAAGYARLGLSVAADNAPARKLYARLGYRDCGVGEYSTGGPPPAPAGSPGWFDTSYYLVKELE